METSNTLPPIRTQGEQPIYLYQSGERSRHTVIVSSRPLPEFVILEKSQVFIDPAILDQFTAWLKSQMVDDAVKALDSSKGKVGRMREDLGIQKHKKSGTSRATAWRRRKAQEQENG